MFERQNQQSLSMLLSICIKFHVKEGHSSSCYPFGLNNKAPIIPNIIAADIPELVTSNIPVMTPIRPCSSASAIAPCTSEFAQLVIGIVAPAPAKQINGA